MIVLALLALGLILGSFINALVWRLHEQDETTETIANLEAAKASKKHTSQLRAARERLQALSMRTGRSMCSRCGHPLAPADLIPLFSWLALRGKCRYCHQPIADTPWLEAGLPVAFVISYLSWPAIHSPVDLPIQAQYSLVSFICWLVFLTAFAALAVYDIRWYLLPDRIVWPVVGLAFLQVALHATIFGGGSPVWLSAFWGVIIDSGLFYILYYVSKGEWIGFGDVKLGIALGLLAGGPLPALMVLFLASALGTLASLPQLVQRKLKRNSVIPFGPFLLAGACIVVLYGHLMVDALTAYVTGV